MGRRTHCVRAGRSSDDHARQRDASEPERGARACLIDDGTLAPAAVVIAAREFRVGERVIARRNDRHRGVDNGTCATVQAVDTLTGTLVVETDSGGRRELDAAYVSEHLEHAYALTGHGTQGATVEWAGVVGRPADFSAEWAYTALSRARERTQLHVITEPSARLREREHYGPPELRSGAEEALNNTCLAMMRRQAERLAIEHFEPAELPETVAQRRSCLPLCQLAEAGAESASTSRRPPAAEVVRQPPPEPDWRALQRQRDQLERGGPHLQR
jgi:hypothetical protein